MPPLPLDKATATAFSPREGATLKYYADLQASAKEIACFTVAFTLAKEFEPFLEEDNDVLRYVLSDKKLAQRSSATAVVSPVPAHSSPSPP